MTPDDQDASPETAGPDRWLTACAVAGALLLCGIVTVTVISRWLYKSVIPDDVLLVRELMVLVILFPLAAVTARRMHISVTIFTERAPGILKSGLDRLGAVAGLVFVGFLLWAGVRMLSQSWSSGDYYDGDLNIPMWLAHGVYVLALGAFFVRLAIAAIGARRG